MTAIKELNRRVNIKSWTSSTDPGGGVSALQVLSFHIWAKVEARSGQPFISPDQQLWNYDYSVTFRYQRGRVVGSNFTIDYDSKRLKINSISFENEGARKMCNCRCTTIDSSVNTTADVSIITLASTFDYYGTGGEDSFIADGSPMSAPTIAKDIRNKTILGAYKDGILFNVILSPAAFDPAVKQVRYTPSTGFFEWSIPFEPGEHALIQYF